MRKVFYLIFIFLTIINFDVFADARAVARTWRGGGLRQRFIAEASGSVLSYKTYKHGYDAIGRWVGTAPIGTWAKVCNKSDKGCTRPRTAYCDDFGFATDRVYDGPYIIGSSSNESYRYFADASVSHSGGELLIGELEEVALI